MAIMKPGFLNAVGALTRAWPSLPFGGTAETIHINLRHLSSQALGTSSQFPTRSAVHTRTCTATQQLETLSSGQILPFKIPIQPAHSSHQSGATHISLSRIAPCSGRSVLPGSLQYHSCSFRKAETECFATGRHYQTSSSSRSQSSSEPLQDKSAAEHASSVDELGAVCWGCKQQLPRGNLVCNSCHKVQPVNTQLNYFEVMGLPQDDFDIETAKLDARYKALQWQMHPDLSAHKPASEKEFSAQQSMVVNMAYGVLRTPLSRANYMLTLQGIKAGENAEGTILDPELLMEVMEAREEVECTTDTQALVDILNSNRASQRQVLAELSSAFAVRNLTSAVSAVTKLTYLVRLEEEVVIKLPSLDGLSTVISASSANSQAQQPGQHQ